MIAEPYICIKGPKLGAIEWFENPAPFLVPAPVGVMLGAIKIRMEKHDVVFQRYADFEREKLKELEANVLQLHPLSGYVLYFKKEFFCTSAGFINYDTEKYRQDSESSRLLKRAEFLRSVCEKEGVEWLATVWCACGRRWAKGQCECGEHHVNGVGEESRELPCRAHKPIGYCTLCDETFTCPGDEHDRQCKGKPERDYYTRSEDTKQPRRFRPHRSK